MLPVELKFEWDTNIDKDTSHFWKEYIKGFKNVSSMSAVLFSSMAFVINLRSRIAQLCMLGFSVVMG